MQETEEAPTRPLDAFEKRALSRLERGEEVVLETSDESIRMMGSLRASDSSCTRCHRVAEGTLLGAITYVLTPAETSVSIRQGAVAPAAAPSPFRPLRNSSRSTTSCFVRSRS